MTDGNEYFYLQDTRSVVGNSMLWWACNDSGYTCDIRCARAWSAEDLLYTFPHGLPNKYKSHKKKDIDKLIQYHIDIQDVGKDSPHTLRHWRKDLVQALNESSGEAK